MEICQHCEMYTEPFFVEEEDGKRARCEFCDKTIATVIDGKWVKLRKED